MIKKSKPTTDIMVYITKSGKFRARIKPKGVPAYEVTVGGINWMEGLANEFTQSIQIKMLSLYERVTSEKDRLLKKHL